MSNKEQVIAQKEREALEKAKIKQVFDHQQNILEEEKIRDEKIEEAKKNISKEIQDKIFNEELEKQKPLMRKLGQDTPGLLFINIAWKKAWDRMMG